MTTNNVRMSVTLRGTGLVTVKWPNGDQTLTLSPGGEYASLSRNFGTAQNRTITILGENITYFFCTDNELLTLDLSECTALQWLYCYNNQFTSLGVSDFTALKNLNVTGNTLLTSLDVSGCTALKELYCNNNQLTEAGLNALFEMLPYNSSHGTLRIGNNPGTSACTQSIATSKNLNVVI